MRYAIRWFKCKLKPPKNSKVNHKLHSLLSYLPFYHLHPSPHLSQISRLNHHHHQNLLNHHPNPCDSHLLHLNHHRKIFSLNPKNPPISSQVLELCPCDSWRRRRRRRLISESSQPTSAQPPSASKEGEDDDVEILDVGDITLPHAGQCAVFPSAIPVCQPVTKGVVFPGAIPVCPPPKKTTAKQSLIVSLPMFPVQQRPPQASLPPAVQSLVSQVVASVSPVVSASSSGSSGASGRSSKPLQLITCPQPNCTYTTYNKGDYKIHKDKHLGIRYKCGSCIKDFGSHKARQTYFRTTHLGQHRSLCSVPECNFSHNDHGITKVHMYNAHGLGEEPKCLHADCVNRPNFTNFRVFDRHRQNYHVARDTQCPHCQKMYKGVENLASHIKSLHSHLPSHQCDQCGLFYASKKSLKTHQDTQH